MKKCLKKARYAGCALVVALFYLADAHTLLGVTLIEDAQIDSLLQTLTTPLARAAHLPASGVSVHVLSKREVNAFVVGGQDLFINAGLLMYVETPGELQGVIAHELGHMAGGHVIRYNNDRSNFLWPLILGVIAGVTAVAAGAGGPGMALAGLGQQVSQNNAMTYSRIRESSADQAAVSYLNSAHLSGAGFLALLKRFAENEKNPLYKLNAFLLTHPLSQTRFEDLKKRILASPYYTKKTPQALDNDLRMAQAKLHGFLDDPQQTLNLYAHKTGTDALYARAIAYQIQGFQDKALNELNEIFKTRRDDPFVWQMKGRFLLEDGQPVEALKAYKMAREKGGDLFEFLFDIGRTLLSLPPSKESSRQAIAVLKKASTLNPQSPQVFYELAIAYHRNKQDGLTYLATAKRYALLGYLQRAKQEAHRALKKSHPGSPEWLQAQDILTLRLADR